MLMSFPKEGRPATLTHLYFVTFIPFPPQDTSSCPNNIHMACKKRLINPNAIGVLMWEGREGRMKEDS